MLTSWQISQQLKMDQGFSKIVLFPGFEAVKRKRVPFPCLGESNKFGILETFLRKKCWKAFFWICLVFRLFQVRTRKLPGSVTIPRLAGYFFDNNCMRALRCSCKMFETCCSVKKSILSEVNAGWGCIAQRVVFIFNSQQAGVRNSDLDLPKTLPSQRLVSNPISSVHGFVLVRPVCHLNRPFHLNNF